MGVACNTVLLTELGRSSRTDVEGKGVVAVCGVIVDWVGSKGSSAMELIVLANTLVGGGAVCDAEMNPSEEGSCEGDESAHNGST